MAKKEIAVRTVKCACGNESMEYVKAKDNTGNPTWECVKCGVVTKRQVRERGKNKSKPEPKKSTKSVDNDTEDVVSSDMKDMMKMIKKSSQVYAYVTTPLTEHVVKLTKEVAIDLLEGSGPDELEVRSHTTPEGNGVIIDSKYPTIIG